MRDKSEARSLSPTRIRCAIIPPTGFFALMCKRENAKKKKIKHVGDGDFRSAIRYDTGRRRALLIGCGLEDERKNANNKR